MQKMMKIAAALSVAALPAAALAQDEKPVEPAQETASRAGMIFALFGAATQSEDVPVEEKNRLVACLYGNTLEKVSAETGKLLAANPQLDAKDQGVVYAAAATVCGAKKPADGAAPADGR